MSAIVSRSNRNWFSFKQYYGLTNIIYAIAVMAVLMIADLLMSNFLNSSYLFNFAGIFSIGTFVVFISIFICSFLNRLINRVVLFLLFLICSLQWMSFSYFGTHIQPIQIIQLMPDFGLVARSFFEIIGEMVPVFLLMAFTGILLFLVDRVMGHQLERKPVYALFLIAFTVWDAQYIYRILNAEDGKVTALATNLTLPMENRLAVDNFYRSATYLSYGMLPKILFNQVKKAPALPEPVVAFQPTDVNVFFLINETVRSSRMSVLGFEGFDTTPKLKNMSGLHSSSIYSASTMTRTSFAGIFHRLKHPWIGEQFNSKSNCLYRLAKQNEFKTHFIYSYGMGAAKTLFPFMCKDYIENIRTRDDAPKELRKYDDNLFYELEKMDFSGNNFVVIGLHGAHTPYKANYSDEFNLTNNTYDNSILYTDYSIDRIINIVKRKSQGKPAVIISTSDHGEILDGEGKLRGHGWLHEHVYNVPFLFKELNNQRNSLQHEAEKVMSHFDVSTLILKALGYDLEVERNKQKTVYINGSDLYGLAGRLEITVRDGNVASIVKVGGGVETPDPSVGNDNPFRRRVDNKEEKLARARIKEDK